MSGPGMVEQPVKALVVDDDSALRSALVRFLSNQGYSVASADTGQQALELVGNEGFDLMLLDIRMPGMNGIDVVPEALHQDPDLAIIMLSALSDATSAAICMQRGAVDYLTKPIELNDLSKAIDRALRKRDTLIQGREISAWLKEEVQRRSEEIKRERQKQQQLTVATLEALVNALEAKHPWLSGHSARVAAFAATVAHHMELSDDEVENVRMAGRLHDLGKIGIREAVLNKQGELTEEEYEHVKQHVLIGSQILAPLENLGGIISFIRSHHEHWDGTGYPDGLKGDDIPIGARIICAAELYDALTTSRPYQDKLSPDEAVERIKARSGTVLDPAVVEAVTASVEARRTLVFIEEDGVLPS
ncbi:MAG: response regulator [Gemmatimonadota bacterium]|nr:MAG: response regulator [Gemmatimonadota bacterium]